MITNFSCAMLRCLVQSFSMSILMLSVDINCHIATASTRNCRTRWLCPKVDVWFWKVLRMCTFQQVANGG